MKSFLPVSILLFSLLSLATPALAQDGEAPQEPAQQGGDVRVTKPPVLVEADEAEYTDAAIKNRVEGPVQLRLTITANGEVSEVELLAGLGYGLDQAAMEAARQFVFEPAEINNQPASVTLSFTINFELPILPSAFTGRVVDAESGEGVEAQIAIRYTGEEYDPAPEASMTTEPDGSFAFENVPPGPYAVTLRVDAYQDYATDIALVAGQTSEATYTVQASPRNLVGQVREAGTRSPLAGVAVELWDLRTNEPIREEFTDAEGRFGFRGLTPGQYSVRFDARGFLASTAGVTVRAGEVTEASFFLDAEFYDEYTVETRTRRARTEVNRQRLQLEEIRRIPGTGGDVVRVVQNLPGVARAPYVSGAIIVRGSAPQDTKIFLDGDPIPLVYHFFGGPAVINSEMIDQLDFYPGNFSTYYGRAIGGVIDLSTRSPKTDRIHGMVEVDLLDATALIEGPITEDLSFALSGRRSYYDVFLPLILDAADADDEIFVTPYYYDYQAWLSYKGIENHTLELLIYGSYDTIEVLLPEDEPRGSAELQITGLGLVNSFVRGQTRWQWRPRLPIENDFMLSYGLNHASFEAAENFYFDTDLYISQIRDDLRLKLSDAFTLRLGADFLLANATYDIRTPRFENDVGGDDGDGQGQPNFSRDGFAGQDALPQLQPAFYVEGQIEPVDRLLLVPGVRVDHYGNLAETTFSPRFSTRWGLTDEVTAKGGVGLFNQPPIPGTEDPLFGNPDIEPEYAWQYAVGAEWRPLEYLEFDVTLFYRDLFNILSNTDAIDVDPQTGETDPVIFSNEGEGRAYGAEVLIRHHPQNRFFGWLAYTLSRSERLNKITDDFEPFRYDQTHILTLVAGYNLPYNFDISARFRLVTGNPYTPVVGSAWDSDSDDYVRVLGRPFSARRSAFHQLDLRVDRKFVFDSWILGLYLDVLNVYNAENPEGINYNYDFTESAPVRGLPILPTFGVSAQF